MPSSFAAVSAPVFKPNGTDEKLYGISCPGCEEFVGDDTFNPALHRSDAASTEPVVTHSLSFSVNPISPRMRPHLVHVLQVQPGFEWPDGQVQV